MRLWIICAASAEPELPRRCSSRALAEEMARILDEPIKPSGAKTVKANGRAVYSSPRQCAISTAHAVVADAEALEEPLLDELPTPEILGGRTLPCRLLRLLIFLRSLLGVGLAAERRRADELIDRLERAGEDCVLVSHPGFIAVLIDRLRVRGYCAQRTGFGRIKPLEQMLLSRRDEHCGGCAHNCLLSNPGCNIGRDKAARAAR